MTSSRDENLDFTFLTHIVCVTQRLKGGYEFEASVMIVTGIGKALKGNMNNREKLKSALVPSYFSMYIQLHPNIQNSVTCKPERLISLTQVLEENV